MNFGGCRPQPIEHIRAWRAAVGLRRARSWSAENPRKVAAHIAVYRAISRGKLEHPAVCGRCGRDWPAIQAHHEDYSRPLEVTWLCRWCHGERHREINSARREMARAAA